MVEFFALVSIVEILLHLLSFITSIDKCSQYGLYIIMLIFEERAMQPNFMYWEDKRVYI